MAKEPNLAPSRRGDPKGKSPKSARLDDAVNPPKPLNAVKPPPPPPPPPKKK